MNDVEQRLRSWTIDWNGAPMVDGEPPRDGLHCRDIRDACDEIQRLRSIAAERMDLFKQAATKVEELSNQLVKSQDALRRIGFDQYTKADEQATSDQPLMIWQSVARSALTDEIGKS